MGIQINGTNDTINAADGSFTLVGASFVDPTSLSVSGVGTFQELVVNGNASIGGTITYMDVTNIDSVGIITAQQGIQVLANGLDVTGFSTFSSGVSVTGVVTATSFSGDGSNLTGISAGARGGGDDEVFYENGQSVTVDYTISTSKNAMSAGPIGISTGITVTIPSGSTWTIV